jgi:hypothetical protein
MQGIEHASPAMLLILATTLFAIVFFTKKAKKNSDIYIRKIAGVDAIEDAVGTATEIGRPISFCTGLSSVGPVLYACLGVLYHITRRAARLKLNLIVPQTSPDAMAVVDEVVREAYQRENRLSLFDPSSIRFLSEEQFAFASGYIGLIHREKVGAAFLFGSFAAESLILSEAGQQVGAMQVAASVSPEQVAFFVCTCDYTLIGEELFAASAYLSREPIQIGSLCGQDYIKLMFLAFIIIGTLIATVNSIWPVLNLLNIDQILFMQF